MPQCPLHTCEILETLTPRNDVLKTGASYIDGLDKRVLDWLIADCRQLHAFHVALEIYDKHKEHAPTEAMFALVECLLNLRSGEVKNHVSGWLARGTAQLEG